MRQNELEPGMVFEGHNKRNGYPVTREIISIDGRRLTYRSRSKFCPEIERNYTCDIAEFFMWAAKDVTEGEAA